MATAIAVLVWLCAPHWAGAQESPPAVVESPVADTPEVELPDSEATPGAALTDPDAAPPAKTPSAARDDLPIEQGRLADRYKRLEEVMGRLAELSASTDPRRAKLLREAIAKSREEDISVRFESVIKLLEQERLSTAATNQTELHKELDGLLALLLKADRDRELASERERVKQYLKEVGRLIRLEKGLRARTEEGDDAKRLADDQKRVAEDTGKLEKNIDENEREQSGESPDAKPADGESSDKDGKPSKSDKSDKSAKPPSDADKSKPGDSKPGDQKLDGNKPKGEPSDSKPSDGQPSDSSKPTPSEGNPAPGQPGSPPPGEPPSGEQSPSPPKQPADRPAENLRKAQQKMDDARKKLDDVKREGAVEDQKSALQELEQAKAELERILRQLREEEMERTLTQLAARFRKMLAAQTAVYEGTVRVDKVPEADRDHDDEIEAARLSREESQIAREADKAMLLLREEGSSVAFPEAVEQMQEDMQQVVTRLAAMKVGTMTQGLEEDIIAALEETIAALDKAVKDLEKNRTPPGQPQNAGQQAEPPLVNKLAELKMIRSLQVRIYERTKRYGQMIADAQQADTPELLEALDKLAERQQRVVQATFDLSQGRND